MRQSLLVHIDSIRATVQSLPPSSSCETPHDSPSTLFVSPNLSFEADEQKENIPPTYSGPLQLDYNSSLEEDSEEPGVSQLNRTFELESPSSVLCNAPVSEVSVTAVTSNPSSKLPTKTRITSTATGTNSAVGKHKIGKTPSKCL